MSTERYEIELLTDTLCHGVEPRSIAELRVPSIRGQLRRWHTILWGKNSTDECWGAVANGKEDAASASKVVIRIEAPEIKNIQVDILPHKKDRREFRIPGIRRDASFSMFVTFRYLSPDNADAIKEKVRSSIRMWLMLGTLGQRGSRAFGSVWDKSFRYATPSEFMDDVSALLRHSGYSVKLLQLPTPTPKGDDLMKICTDTLSGNPKVFGGINPRQVSPLKMKFVKIGSRGDYYLVLHAHKQEIIDNAINLLKNKPIGKCGIVETGKVL